MRDGGRSTRRRSTASGSVCLSAAFHKYGDAPRAARRPRRKARGGRIPGVFDRRATPRGGMHRRPNATVFMKVSTKVFTPRADIVVKRATGAPRRSFSGGGGRSPPDQDWRFVCERPCRLFPVDVQSRCAGWRGPGRAWPRHGPARSKAPVTPFTAPARSIQAEDGLLLHSISRFCSCPRLASRHTCGNRHHASPGRIAVRTELQIRNQPGLYR